MRARRQAWGGGWLLRNATVGSIACNPAYLVPSHPLLQPPRGLIKECKQKYCSLPVAPLESVEGGYHPLQRTASERETLEGIGKALGISKPEDWYKVTIKTIMDIKGGDMLIARYPSIEQLLRANYPEFNWRPERFSDVRTTKGFFKDLDKQRELLERIGRDLGVKQLSDWYGINYTDVARRGGWRIFKYHTSLPKTLKAIYPGVEWDEDKFTEAVGRVKSGHWQDRKNLLDTLDKAEKILNINQPEDWYTVTLADLQEIGFPSKVKKPELAELLEEKYPDYKWEKVYLLKGRYAQQKRLEKAVQLLFPNTDIKINARKEADLLNPETKEYLELDVYIPALKLAFEYQEKHHYTSSNYTYKPLNIIQERDQKKGILAASKGISLIPVPCWWDGKTESLVTTIKKARPDLLAEMASTGKPIPETAPSDYFKETPHVEGVGEPVTACFFTLSNIDPTDWWMFEKYDGVRGFWNPQKKAFYARSGNLLPFPQEVIDEMPTDLFLDGEIWFGRDNFQEAQKISNRMRSAQIDWSKFKYMVFDVPTHKGTYEERFNYLVEQLNQRKWKYIELARWEKCKDEKHLENFYQSVIDEGGEGVILRDPYAKYQPGRSPGYLKHKKFRDAEAKVVNKIGPQQWECELPNGIRFVAAPGTAEFAKRYNPQPGDIVSFKHHGYLLASKKPKFPTLYRLRTDISWDYVVQNWKEHKIEPKAVPLRSTTPRPFPKGHWNDTENVRKFFVEVAEEMGFDPTIQENWESVTLPQILSKKGVGPLWKYNYSLKAALEAVFEFKQTDVRMKDRHWDDVNNCRAFFDEFAQKKGFDPLNTENWYSMNLKEMLEMKGGSTLKTRQKGWKRALKLAYPELDFSKWD